jgi:FkbM family methyltransferase
LYKHLASYAPESIKQFYRAWKARHLATEINKLQIKDSGVDQDGTPWVKLADDSIFFGLAPSEDQLTLYNLLKNKIKHITKDVFGVVFDIVTRYLLPRSLPGESVNNPSKYMPIRDPLNDYNFPQKKRNQIAKLFRPKEGDVYVDIGAFLGFGTMRIARLVGSTGRVIAFESDPKNLELFQRNMEANGFDNVTIVPKAVASQSGDGHFYRSEGTINSLNSWVLNNLGYEGLETIDVKVISVDDALETLAINTVDLVNITINGGEVDALQGMKKTLNRSENIRITLAGWYYLSDDKKVCDVAVPLLKRAGFVTLLGERGRVLAWKGKNTLQ